MANAGLFVRKSVEQVKQEFGSGELKRTLSAANLVSLGIGCIIGAGIFVLTGNAAADFAGPGVMLSFVLAGIACAFAGLCYAELASTIPVSGSAYSYTYVSMGEVIAWVMGWLLLLEYGVAASTVASGWTGYVTSLLKDFGLVVPAGISTSTLQLKEGALQISGSVNLVGAAGILAVTWLLVRGVRESAQVNNIIVVIKLSVLLIFIGVGLFYIDTANWTPFIPENEGGFKYGMSGVVRAASIIFFAYVGFEAVSTAAGEARNPQKDLPVGILGSLFVCTLLYIVVAAVMTGVVPFRELAGGAPIATAIDRMNPTWAVVPWGFSESGAINLLALLVKVGAFTGLTSVMLVLIYGQTRVFYQMAKDGLLPPLFSSIHPEYRTPARGTMLLGTIIAIAAAVLPLNVLGDMVSLGTAMAFAMVCMSVLYLRKHNPELTRPFTAPGGMITPVLGVVACFGFMILPILLDILSKAFDYDLLGALIGSPGDVARDPAALWILASYALLGVLVYWFYGSRHSKLRNPGQ